MPLRSSPIEQLCQLSAREQKHHRFRSTSQKCLPGAGIGSGSFSAFLLRDISGVVQLPLTALKCHIKHHTRLCS